MKSILRFWIPLIIGVIITVLVISLWRNGEVDWGNVITMAIASFIGAGIGIGIRRIIKKED